MVYELDEVLPLVKLEDPLCNPVVIEGKECRLVGFLPIITEEGHAKLRQARITLQDLFFLEQPRTFATLKRYADKYSLKINLKYL